MLTQDHQTEPIHRPPGIWLLTIPSFIFASLFLLRWAPWFLFPPQHAQMPPTAIAWALLVLVIVFIGSCYGVWAGNRYGRTLLLITLTAITTILLYVDLAELRAAQAYLAENPDDKNFIITWHYTLNNFRFSALIAFWLSVHFWYFRRERPRLFFESRSDTQSHVALYGMAITMLAVPAIIFGAIETIYQTRGAPRHPPAMLTDQLRMSPGSEMTPDERSDNFPFIRHSEKANPWELQESRKFTFLLQKRFPVGSSEANLIAALKQEGFWFPTVEKDCVIKGEEPPEGVTAYTSCSYDSDPAKMLVYGWWRFNGWRRGQCIENVHVHWADEQGKLTEVRGEYSQTCSFILEPRHWY